MYNPTHFELRFTPQEVDRFWSKVNKTDECWLWLGAPNGTGYGVFAFTRQGANTSTSAHRAAYVLTRGQIPDGLHLDHLCPQRLCVNPAHLEPVTKAENNRRRALRMTHCKYGHLLAADNVRIFNSPSGWRRVCVECKRRTGRESKTLRLSRA